MTPTHGGGECCRAHAPSDLDELADLRQSVGGGLAKGVRPAWSVRRPLSGVSGVEGVQDRRPLLSFMPLGGNPAERSGGSKQAAEKPWVRVGGVGQGHTAAPNRAGAVGIAHSARGATCHSPHLAERWGPFPQPAGSPAGKPVAAGGMRLECEAQGPTGATG
jgi:hypothetical protein